jgi:predicted  nucleic acid-binding Zn-ribbon protein
MKPLGLKVTSAVALLALLCFSTTAFAAPARQDGPPRNLKQCKKSLKSVDAALVWENKRYAKANAKLETRRDALTKQSTALTTVQGDLNIRMEALQAAIEDEANPPSQEDADRMVEEYNSLIPTAEENDRSLQSARDELEGLTFDFSELLKTHRSNVRSTVKYRKQVAAFCAKFKR